MYYEFVKYEMGNAADRVRNFEAIREIDVTDGNVVQALRYSEDHKSLDTTVIDSVEALQEFREGLERAFAWAPAHVSSPCVEIPLSVALGDRFTIKVPEPVKGHHYQNYIEELQWIDAMSRIPSLRAPERFKAAVELQIRKYLDRNGRKDEELQELLKGLWYMKYLCAYIKNGNQPIKGCDVDAILSE